VANAWIPSSRDLPRSFWIVWFGTLVNRAGAFVGPFLALYLVGERGMHIERVGEIIALVGLGSLAAGPLGGALADRVGRRRALAASGLVGSAAMLALSIARRPSAIAVCALSLGLFGDMYRPVSASIIADVVAPAHRARAYGLYYWAANLGFSIAPAVAGLVATKSYGALFVGDAATTLLFTGIVVGFVRETRPAPHPDHARAGLATPYLHRSFLAFASVTLLLSALFHQVTSTLLIDMEQHGLPPRTCGLLLALNGVLIVFLQPFAGRRIARMQRAPAMVVSSLLIGFGLGVLVLRDHSVGVYVISAVVWSLGEIAMASILPSVVADFAPSHLRGSYQGAYQVAWGGGCLFAPIAGSFVLAHFGSTTLWGGCIAAGIVVALGFSAVIPDAKAHVFVRQ
jgi:MFS family permease